uniref:hypothetical protein n=1 Tax=Telluribacter sp. SYSU D00476 TaxID=2811430 RepID=UPI001FF6A925
CGQKQDHSPDIRPDKKSDNLPEQLAFVIEISLTVVYKLIHLSIKIFNDKPALGYNFMMVG